MWFRQNPVKQYFENSNETEIGKFLIQFIDPQLLQNTQYHKLVTTCIHTLTRPEIHGFPDLQPLLVSHTSLYKYYFFYLCLDLKPAN